jgi:hypothetical protein
VSDAPDPFEFIKAFWNPLGLPMGSMAAPTLDEGEIDKRISDLKLVENWLNMNLSVLRMSIQAMEMQKMTLAALRTSFTPPGGSPGTGQGTAAAANPAFEAWLKVMQTAVSGQQAASKPPEKP